MTISVGAGAARPAAAQAAGLPVAAWVLLGLALVAVTAAVARRWAVRRNRRFHAGLTLTWLEHAAGQARQALGGARDGWRAETGAAMTARLAELDRRRAGCAARPPLDPALPAAANGLTKEYERFGELVQALTGAEQAAAAPRPEIGELLAAGPDGDPGTARSPAGRRRAAPPPPETLTGLRDRLRRLDRRYAESIDRIRAAPPAETEELTRLVRSQTYEYWSLAADAVAAWVRMFPDRAAARRAGAGGDLVELILRDKGRPVARRSPPPRRRGESGDATGSARRRRTGGGGLDDVAGEIGDVFDR